MFPESYFPADYFPEDYFPTGVSSDPPLPDCGTDMMADAMQALTDTLQEFNSKPIIYDTGTLKIATCATFGHKLFKLDDGEGGFIHEWTDRDFLIPAANLVSGSTRIVPARGHRVKVTCGSTTEVFEVLAPGNESVFQFSDPYGKMLRIHSKRIS